MKTKNWQLIEQDMRKLCAIGGTVTPKSEPPRIDHVEEVEDSKGHKWRTRYHPHTVRVCDECGADTEMVTDKDARTIMTWQCPKCKACY